MATILLVGVDLFLRGKLEGLLPGHRFVTTEGVDPPDLVIADIARIDPNDVADNFPEDALPEKWEPFVRINAAFNAGMETVNTLADEYATEHNVQN